VPWIEKAGGGEKLGEGKEESCEKGPLIKGLLRTDQRKNGPTQKKGVKRRDYSKSMLMRGGNERRETGLRLILYQHQKTQGKKRRT